MRRSGLAARASEGSTIASSCGGIGGGTHLAGGGDHATGLVPGAERVGPVPGGGSGVVDRGLGPGAAAAVLGVLGEWTAGWVALLTTVGTSVAVLSALLPALRANQVSPMAALRDQPELAEPRRWVAVMGVALTGVNLFIFALLAYSGYHYLESNAFCGQFCHEVMNPEYTAYQNSPHSKVHCVDCHIGSGATWFAKSKIP